MGQIKLTDDALEDLRDLDGFARVLVFKALTKLKVNPEQRGQPLGSRQSGDLTGFRKLAVGDRDYRIVYRVESSGDLTVVWVIAKRADDEVYQLAVARARMHPNRQLSNELTTFLSDVWQR